MKQGCVWRGVRWLSIGALFLWGCKEPQPTTREVQIFAVNDIHAAIEHFPRLAYVVDSLRSLYPDLLLVSAGDNQTGNPVNDQYPQRGMPIVQLMNRVGFQVSALGNHEFDVSAAQMIRNLQASQCTYICANAHYQDESHPLQRHKVITLPNGLRVAFASVLYINSTGYPDCHPMHTEGFTFSDPLAIAQEEYHALQENDVLVFLTHLGFEEDIKLAQSLPPKGADVIIGGHSHTLIRQDQYHNDMLITQAGSHLEYGTLVRITHTDTGTSCTQQLLRIASTQGQTDVSLQHMVDSLTQASGFQEPLAVTHQGFHKKETLGYLMADAQRAYAKADVAIMNPGGVRINSLPAGAITMLDIYRLDPFGNEIVSFMMTGTELHEMLEKAVIMDHHSPLIPSGIHLHYSFVPCEGEHVEVKKIELLDTMNRPLDMTKPYHVVMNSYVATVYSFSCQERGKSLQVTTADATIRWLRTRGVAPDYRQEKRILRDTLGL